MVRELLNLLPPPPDEHESRHDGPDHHGNGEDDRDSVPDVQGVKDIVGGRAPLVGIRALGGPVAPHVPLPFIAPGVDAPVIGLGMIRVVACTRAVVVDEGVPIDGVPVAAGKVEAIVPAA